jgi:CHASE3 domain sensor protein
MLSWIRKCISFVLIVASLSFAPSNLKADHVVNPQDLHAAMQASSDNRQQNVEAIQRFIDSDAARAAMKQVNADPQKISEAIPLLSNEELSRLVTQTNQAQMQFAAGYHDDVITILIIILLVVAIVAIVTAVR